MNVLEIILYKMLDDFRNANPFQYIKGFPIAASRRSPAC